MIYGSLSVACRKMFFKSISKISGRLINIVYDCKNFCAINLDTRERILSKFAFTEAFPILLPPTRRQVLALDPETFSFDHT